MNPDDQTFAIINSRILAGFIRTAVEEVILFTPGVDEETAFALIEAKSRLHTLRFGSTLPEK